MIIVKSYVRRFAALDYHCSRSRSITIRSKDLKLKPSVTNPSSTRTTSSKKVQIMPQWLSVWWRSRLGRKETRIFENTSTKSHSRETVNVEQIVDDRNVAISVALSEVSNIAARGLLGVVKAQAGASTTAEMVICLHKYFSECVYGLANNAINVARDIAERAKHHTQTDLPIVIDLRPVVTDFFDGADEIDFYLRKNFDKVDKATKTSYHLESLSATAKAISELNHAIANVVKVHIASIAEPTTMCVPYLEKLLYTAAATATESMRGIVDAVKLMKNNPPPPYEDLGFLSEN